MSEESKKYVDETTDNLIENYKDLIKKTFDVTDKDLLQLKIDDENNEESEEKYLNAIKKRRVALDEVDLMLDKIDKLQKRSLPPEAMKKDEGPKLSHAKRMAQEG